MAHLIVLLLEVLVVAGVVFAAAAVALGRGEVMAPAPRDAAPPELPADRPLTGDDVRDLRFELAFRGYRMADVDAVLDRLAAELGERDREIAERDRELETLRSARFGRSGTDAADG